MPLQGDLRIALRTLLRSPGRLALPAVVLGLALASVVVMWGTLRFAVLEDPPFERVERLVTVALGPGDEPDDLLVALPDLHQWFMAQSSFEGMAGFRPIDVVVTDAGPTERRVAGVVTGPFFQLLRQPPLLGRVLAADDVRPDAPPVVVLSERLWRERFGGRADALGQVIRVDGLPSTVIGVVPRAFDVPIGADLWLAFRFSERGYSRIEWFTPIARLRDGVTHADAEAELAALSRPRARPTRAPAPELRPFALIWLGPRYARILRACFLSVMLVLALAAANVTGLLLIRAAGRGHEAAIRRALGASRGRLVLELLAEPLVIGAAAGLVGLTLAAAAIELLLQAAPDSLPAPAWLAPRLDGQMLLVLGVAAFGSALAAGLYPALRASGVALDPLLRQGTPQGGLRAGRVVGALVVVEIALSAAVLTSAGVVIRAAARLARGDVGVPTAGLLVGRLELPVAKYEWRMVGTYLERLDGELSRLPGPEAAALGHSAPGLWGQWRDDWSAGPRAGVANVVPVGPRYFDALRIPLRGRAPGAEAVWRAPLTAVVSEAFARAAWPGEDPVGRTFTLDPGTSAAGTFTVVGVARDVRHDQRVQSVDFAFPTVYPALLQWHGWSTQVVLRARPGQDPSALAPALQALVRRLDPEIALYGLATLDGERQRAAAGFGLIGWMFAAFGAVAVSLAAAGVYGVLSAGVAQGARELALRRALGAPDRAIVGLILGRCAGQLAAGLALGALAAPLAAAALGGTLETQAHVPAVYAVVAAVLVLAMAIAVAFPLRRALRADPGPELRRG